MKLRELLAEDIMKMADKTAAIMDEYGPIGDDLSFFSGALYACDLLDERVEGLVKALERIKNGTHEKYPVCAHIGVNNFGPPRTDGWEGWAREIDSAHKNIAKEALETFKKGFK